jgi:hypothetical protein
VLIDHTNARVLDVLESREKAAGVAWLEAQKKSGLLDQLEEVTCDMWDAYAEAPKEVFGDQVRVTIDRFHVMKNFQDQLTQARREIQRGLPQDQAKELKGSRWLWVTNPENLAAEQQKQLEALKRKFPALAKLSQHREKLRDIFQDKRVKRPDTAVIWLRAWCERGQDRQLLRRPLEQRANRGVQPRPADHPLAGLRDAQLRALPPASAPRIRMSATQQSAELAESHVFPSETPFGPGRKAADGIKSGGSRVKTRIGIDSVRVSSVQ